MPPYLTNILINKKGQKVIEVGIVLPSGVKHGDVIIRVDDDNEHLNLLVPMDKNLADGWAMHGEMVPDAKSLTKEQRLDSFRVYTWNSLIQDMRTTDGELPKFQASISLPDVVCSQQLLRESAKESRGGTRLLVVELLVEDEKLPAASKKRTVQKIGRASCRERV